MDEILPQMVLDNIRLMEQFLKFSRKVINVEYWFIWTTCGMFELFYLVGICLLLSRPEHLRSSTGFSWIRAAESLVFCVLFLTIFVWHCIVCLSIYGSRLTVLYLQTFSDWFELFGQCLNHCVNISKFNQWLWFIITHMLIWSLALVEIIKITYSLFIKLPNWYNWIPLCILKLQM